MMDTHKIQTFSDRGSVHGFQGGGGGENEVHVNPG